MSQGKILPSEIGLDNFKFDTALKINDCIWFNLNYDHLHDHSFPKRLFLPIFPNNGYREWEVSTKILAKFIRKSLTCLSTACRERFDSFLTTAWEYLAIQEEHLISSAPKDLQTQYEAIIHESRSISVRLPDNVLSLYSACCDMDKLLDHLSMSRDRRKLHYLHLEILDFKFTTADNFSIIEHSGKFYLCNRDQLTMIHNKIHEIFNCLITGFLFSKHNIWSSDFYNCQLRLLTFMIDKIDEFDNQAYTIFKNFDGISSAYILAQETYFKNDLVLNDLLSELSRDRLLRGRDFYVLERIFKRTPHESIEFSAMSKLCGHPAIDTLLGIDKLRLRTTQVNEIRHEDVSLLICSMKENFILTHLLRYKRWPVISVSPRVNKTIMFCRFNNIWINDPMIPSSYPPIQLEDFREINLEKVHDFDYIDSQFDILKDTALAQVRSLITGPLVHSPKSRKDQRTLLYFLMANDPTSDVRKYFKLIDNNDPLCLEYLVIKLTQKERELKIEGRFFGQSPYVERMRRCILEKNVSILMEKYNKNQAMTLSELQKFKKMYILSRLSETQPDFIPVYISIDVEAFNNNFRRSACEPVGREFFNNLTGTQHYTHIMDTFEKSLFTITDNIHLYSWNGQYGGIEGLFQKFWTWMYEAVADRVATLTRFNHFILVNGDDLRIVLLIPKAEAENVDLRVLLDEINQSFETNFTRFGFKFKLSETYTSTFHLGFGKIYLTKGYFNSNTLKKVAKIHGLANLMGDYPLEYIKGVQAEIQSVMSVSVNHRLLYYISIIRIQMYLTKFNPAYLKLTLMQKLTLLLWPSNFGGLPILPYLRCLYKGDSDLETIWMSLYRYIYQINPEFGTYVILHVFSYITKATSYHGLASNPYSIPNNTPPEGITIIQSFIRKNLPRICNNKYFSRLLDKTDQARQDRYLRDLFSCSPLPPKVLNILYSTSAAGILEEFLKTFDSSKSIGGLMTGSFTTKRSRKLLIKAKSKDLYKIAFLIKNVSEIKYDNDFTKVIFENISTCSTLTMDRLRTFCYSKDLVGITYPCIAEQCSMYDKQTMTGISNEDFITISRSRIDKETNANYSHGPNQIFLGNHTHLKLLVPDLELKTSSPGLKRVVKLLKLYSMFATLGNDCKEYIKRNLEDLTGMDPNLLLEVCYQHSSGSISHRVPSNHWSPLVGPNDLSNRSSYVLSDTRTDRNSRIRSGDFTINYGLVKSHINLMTMYQYEFSSFITSTSENYWLRLGYCDTCTFEVSDGVVSWNRPPPSLNFNLQGNPYVSLTEIEIQELTTLIQSIKTSRSFQQAQQTNMTGDELLRLARILMARTILDQTSEPLKKLYQDMKYPSMAEEDLTVLLALPSVELSSLTDLKCLPSEDLFNAMEENYLSWIIDNYPETLCRADPIPLLNLPLNRLPFMRISALLIETGYWPLFCDHLKRYTDLTAPITSFKDSDIQRFICRVIFTRLTTKTGSQMMNYIVPVTQYPENHNLIKHVNSQIRMKRHTHLYKWIQHEGQAMRKHWLDGNFASLTPLINNLLQVQPVPYALENEQSFSPYQFTKEKDGMLIREIMLLFGAKDHEIEGIINYLKDFEEGIEDINTRYFTSMRVQLVFIMPDRTAREVRSHQSQDFADYYGASTSTLITPSIKTSFSRSIRSVKFDVIFQPSHLNIDSSTRRLKLLCQKLEDLTFLRPVFGVDVYLSLYGSHKGNSILILAVLNDLNIKLSGNGLIVNDFTGMLAAASALSTREQVIVLMTQDYSEHSSGMLKFPELDFIFLEYASRLKRTYCNSGVGDFMIHPNRKLVLTEYQYGYCHFYINQKLFLNYDSSDLLSALFDLKNALPSGSYLFLWISTYVGEEVLYTLIFWGLRTFRTFRLIFPLIMSKAPYLLLIVLQNPMMINDNPTISYRPVNAVARIISEVTSIHRENSMERGRMTRLIRSLSHRPLILPTEEIMLLQSICGKHHLFMIETDWEVGRCQFLEYLQEELLRLDDPDPSVIDVAAIHKDRLRIETQVIIETFRYPLQEETTIGAWMEPCRSHLIQTVKTNGQTDDWIQKMLYGKIIPAAIRLLCWCHLKYGKIF